ncbi:hypothetical protein FB451DRAFT_1204979 [Mycena latifolia]|nr:hypothetical protein FB451DRAFT_1204979 [Mycena latifolia]
MGEVCLGGGVEEVCGGRNEEVCAAEVVEVGVTARGDADAGGADARVRVLAGVGEKAANIGAAGARVGAVEAARTGAIEEARKGAAENAGGADARDLAVFAMELAANMARGGALEDAGGADARAGATRPSKIFAPSPSSHGGTHTDGAPPAAKFKSTSARGGHGRDGGGDCDCASEVRASLRLIDGGTLRSESVSNNTFSCSFFSGRGWGLSE